MSNLRSVFITVTTGLTVLFLSVLIAYQIVSATTPWFRLNCELVSNTTLSGDEYLCYDELINVTLYTNDSCTGVCTLVKDFDHWEFSSRKPGEFLLIFTDVLLVVLTLLGVGVMLRYHTLSKYFRTDYQQIVD